MIRNSPRQSGTAAGFPESSGDRRPGVCGARPTAAWLTAIAAMLSPTVAAAILQLKWLHEVQTENKLQGDTLWLKAVYKF